MSTWLINRRNKWNCVFRRLEGIFPGRLIEVSLQRPACIVSNGIAVYWLILCYCLLQNSMKSSRLGFARLWLPGTAILTSCFGSPGNYLNRIHLKAENSAFCDNPSFASYFNRRLRNSLSGNSGWPRHLQRTFRNCILFKQWPLVL